MLGELIQGFDEEIFCAFLNAQFSGSFSKREVNLPKKKEFPWELARQLGVVKTLPGSKGENRPLLVVSAQLREGEVLTERSSRIRQFKFAKQVLDEAMANPAPGVEGILSQGLFAFYDDSGNFRLSLVHGQAEGTRLVWSTAKRLSFYVEAGQPNKTFRDRAELDWSTFEKLKGAFSVEKLTKEFYTRLFAWYQRAMESDEVVFPNDLVKDKEAGEVKSEQIIRLITRLMFVWFLKQKHLVPNGLFDPESLADILKEFDPVKGENYYRAILQNLFFATLNTEISDRAFAIEGSRQENEEHFGVKIFYRYAAEFAVSEEEVVRLFRSIPFMNGGLFECLDRDNHYYDGFSRRKSKRAAIPNALFFDEKGLIPLLSQYNFTVEENSPGDEEVALDPEMLGKVFENLLAAYNPETNTQARKATGSFYTPREIVNYMVDESLIAHLCTTCGEDQSELIRRLFREGARPSDETLCQAMDAALVRAKILDPACGSGAFPMGILLRMVNLLRILRQVPEEQSVYDLKLELIKNCIYGGDIQCIAVQISKLRFFISLVCEQKPTEDPETNYGIHTLPNLETKFVAADSLIGLPREGKDVLDLCTGEIAELKNELFEVRLRHFSARSFQEKKELRKEDRALRAKIKRTVKRDAEPDRSKLDLLKKEREKVAEPKWVSKGPNLQNAEMFSEFSESAKPEQSQFDENEKKRKQLDAEITREEQKISLPTTVVDEIADMLASWDPYDQNASADFSDPEWMFNVKDGFDVVIGNPPYGVKYTKREQNILKHIYKTYSLRGESYVLFVEKGIKSLSNYGTLSYIIPDTYLNLEFTQPVRDFILSHTKINQVYSLPSKIFESAVVDTTLLFTTCVPDKCAKLDYTFKVSRIENKSNNFDLNFPDTTYETYSDLWRKSRSFNVHSSPREIKVLNKIDNKSISLEEIANVLSGIKVYEVGKGSPPQTKSIRNTKPYTSSVKIDDKWSPFYEGKHIIKFGDQWDNNSWIHYGEWLAAPREYERFKGEKLFIRKIVDNRLIGTFIKDNAFCNTLLFVVKPKEKCTTSLKFLLAVLCSSFIGWYFRKKFQISSADTFPQIMARDILKLPIIMPTREQSSKIESMVEQILTAKKADPNTDTTALESEIDQLVYKLYDLTPEEIKIVESATAASAPGKAKAKKDSKLAPPKSTARKAKKTKLPPSLPGWD